MVAPVLPPGLGPVTLEMDLEGGPRRWDLEPESQVARPDQAIE